MKIGLIDVDTHNFPNLPLMKLSAWHKRNGNNVEWYDIFGGEYDVVYCSKVFSFTADYQHKINAKKIIKGGSGYHIKLVNGREIYDKTNDNQLPNVVEHIYPDYSLYEKFTKDTAYGFLTRGCPRGCEFCIVKDKEGLISEKVADLNEFWHGQKNIVLNDPNIIACKDREELLIQLIDSKANIDFNQGIDIRLMTEDLVDLFNILKFKEIHFAWDKYNQKDMVLSKLELWNRKTIKKIKPIVYTIVNFDTTFKQDIERVEFLKKLNMMPYIMIYNKEHCNKEYLRLQRYVNNRIIFNSVDNYYKYK